MGERVKVLTNDGRVFVGVLKGLDQSLNAVLASAQERVYSADRGVVVHELGAYLVRGEGIMCMGAFAEGEEELEGLEEVRAAPMLLE